MEKDLYTGVWLIRPSQIASLSAAFRETHTDPIPTPTISSLSDESKDSIYEIVRRLARLSSTSVHDSSIGRPRGLSDLTENASFSRLSSLESK